MNQTELKSNVLAFGDSLFFWTSERITFDIFSVDPGMFVQILSCKLKKCTYKCFVWRMCFDASLHLIFFYLLFCAGQDKTVYGLKTNLSPFIYEHFVCLHSSLRLYKIDKMKSNITELSFISKSADAETCARSPFLLEHRCSA